MRQLFGLSEIDCDIDRRKVLDFRKEAKKGTEEGSCLLNRQGNRPTRVCKNMDKTCKNKDIYLGRG